MISRPIRVVGGALLLVPALLLAWAGVGMPLIYGRTTDLATLSVSAASLWGAFVGLSTSWRLLANRSRPDGGLVSPRFLRGAGFLFAALPVLAVATGSWRDAKTHPAILIGQMLAYFVVALALFRLARKREIEKPAVPVSGR
jgi:hypothetical protein